jgi:hypothetical protein
LLNVAAQRVFAIGKLEVQSGGNDYHVGALAPMVSHECNTGFEIETTEVFGMTEVAVNDNEVFKTHV